MILYYLCLSVWWLFDERKSASEKFHETLDWLGFLPGPAGMAADAVNALLYSAEGKHEEAAMSTLAIIPVVGEKVAATKHLQKTLKTYNKMQKIKSHGKKAASGIEFIIHKAG